MKNTLVIIQVKKTYIVSPLTHKRNRNFDELLERIKTIRVSERMAYQKITDLFIATATDYNPKSEEAYTFFKIVQNKLHFAISGHTAAN